MKIAIAMFNDEISPRFDCCTKIAFMEYDKNGNTQEHLDPDYSFTSDPLANIIEHKTDLLLCGGIRRCDLIMLHSLNIKTIYGLSGKAMEMLDRYLSGKLTTIKIANNQNPNCPRIRFHLERFSKKHH